MERAQFVVILLASLGIAATQASGQELAAAAASPEKLAKFVETHNDFSWQPLWNALNIHDAEIFLPMCEEDTEGVLGCSAELIRVDDPPQTIVVLEHKDSGFQVFLRYQRTGKDAWQFAGAFAPLAKYFRLEHRITRLGRKPFLVTTSQGISGTGLSSKIECWIDLTRRKFEPVFDVPAEGHYYPFPNGIARETRGKVVSLAAIPVERITVAFHVDFELYEDGPAGNEREVGLAERSDTVVFARGSQGNFKIDPRLSTATEQQVDDVYDINDDPDVSNKEFLKFNLKELSAIAGRKTDARRAWLIKFLQNCPDTLESRKLKALVASAR